MSTDPKEMELKMLEASKPYFIKPWSPEMPIVQLKLAEETLVGYVIVSLPAYNPVTGNRIADIELQGDMAEFFSLNPINGEIFDNNSNKKQFYR
jgi:hypothetical protein